MSEQAGRLYLDVESDTSGFARDLRRKIEAEARGITAKVKAEVDSRGLKAQVKRAAAEASAAAKVKLAVELQTRGLNAQMKAIAAEASAAAKVRLGVEVDSAQMEAEVAKATTQAAGRGKAKVKVDADTTEAEAKVDETVAKTNRKSATIKVKIDKDTLSQMTQIGGAVTKIVGLVGIIGSAIGPVLNLVGGLGQVVAGLFAIASAAGPAAGAIALIPAALAGAVQILGTVMSAFSGVGKAIGAADKTASAGAKAAQTQAKQREAAARAIESAQRRLADAQQQVGRTAESNARSIESAERRVADSVRASRQAQEDLNRARQEAAETLEDLRLQLSGALLDEEAARIALTRAQQRRDQVFNAPGATSLDKQEADLAVRQAEQRLKEIIESNEDLAKSEAAAEKAGIEGATNVVAAKQKVADANQEQSDAERDLARQRKDNAQSMADAMQGVRDAQRGVADAQRQMAEALDASSASGTQAMSAYEQAMAGLPPSAQKFVRYMRGEFLPMWKEVRVAAADALLPRAETALRALSPMVAPIKSIVTDTGNMLGDLMVKAAHTITTPLWQRDLLTIGKNNTKSLRLLGGAAIDLLDPLRDILVVVGDGPKSLVGRFATWTKGLTANVKATVAAKRENGQLAAFFERTGDVLAQWGRIIGNISKGIYNIGRDSVPAGQKLTDSFEGATETFVTWTKTNGKEIRGFFDRLVPVVESFGRILVGVSKLLGGIMNDPHNQAMMQAVETKLVPALDRLVKAFMDAGTGDQLIGVLVTLSDTIVNLVNSGALGHFMDTLETIVGWLHALSETTIGQNVFSALFTFAAIAGPLGLAVGWVGKLVNFADRLVRIKGLKKAVDALRGLTGLGPSAGGGTGGTGGPVVVPGGKGKGKGKVGKLGGKVGGAAKGAGALGAVLTVADMVPAGDGTDRSLLQAEGEANIDDGKVIGSAIWAGIKAGFGDKAAKEDAKRQWKAIWDDFVHELKLDVVVGWMNMAGESVNSFLDGVLAGLTGFGQTINNALDTYIRQPVEGFFTALFVGLPVSIVKGFSSVSAAWNAKWAAARDYVSTALGTARQAMARWFAGLPGSISAWFTATTTMWGQKWTAARDFVSTALTTAKTRMGQIITSIPASIGGWFSGLWSSWTTKWGSIRDYATARLNEAKSRLWTIIDGIRANFATGVSNIGKAWDGLRSKAKVPVDFVVNTVYNNGIRGVWNKVAGLINAPQLPAMKFATGGVVPGYAPGKDTRMAMVSPGEGWLVPEAVRGLAGMLGTSASGAIQSINSAFSSRVTSPGDGSAVPAFAGGGVVGAIGDLFSGAKKKAGSVIGGAKDLFVGGLRSLAQKALSPFYGALNSLGRTGSFGGLIGSAGTGLINQLLGFLGKKDSEAPPIPEGAGNVARWAPTVKQVLDMLGQSESLIPWVLQLISHESGGNPNAINRWDINAQRGIPSQGLMQTIPPTFATYAGPFRARGILDPLANVYAGLNYGIHRYGSVANIPGIRSLMHGGAYQPYDTGGIWESGTTGINLTGKPEVVFTDSQWQVLRRVADHAVTSVQTDGVNKSIGTYISEGAVQFLLDGRPNDPSVQQYEKTLNDGMRRMATFGLFDGGGK